MQKRNINWVVNLLLPAMEIFLTGSCILSWPCSCCRLLAKGAPSSLHDSIFFIKKKKTIIHTKWEKLWSQISASVSISQYDFWKFRELKHTFFQFGCKPQANFYFLLQQPKRQNSKSYFRNNKNLCDGKNLSLWVSTSEKFGFASFSLPASPKIPPKQQVRKKIKIILKGGEKILGWLLFPKQGRFITLFKANTSSNNSHK